MFLNRITTVYNAEADTGVRWDSCGTDWLDAARLLQDEVREMIALIEFKSPFDQAMP